MTIEPHLRSPQERAELFQRLELLSAKLCQTQGFILKALAESGLDVVPARSESREV